MEILFFQATRHARRVYVGGLPPTANEQVILSSISIGCHFILVVGCILTLAHCIIVLCTPQNVATLVSFFLRN